MPKARKLLAAAIGAVIMNLRPGEPIRGPDMDKVKQIYAAAWGQEEADKVYPTVQTPLTNYAKPN